MEKFFETVEMNCFFKSFLHVITRKASRAECGAACRVDRLSAGLIGRLGVPFNARRSEQIGHGLKQSDVVILNTGETLTPALSLYKRRGSKVKEILNQVQNDDINNRNGLFPSHHSLFTRKLAFTLAEVLITLGIIGIVAAMTIPNLITNYQKKQTALEVKKAYTELNQILKMAIADYGEPSGWDYYKANELPLWVQTYFEPYVKVSGAKTCTSMEECLGLPLPYSLKFAKPGSVNTQVGQYAVSKLGSPIGYGFFRYGGVYENVTRVKVYIRKTTGKKLAWKNRLMVMSVEMFLLLY